MNKSTVITPSELSIFLLHTALVRHIVIGIESPVKKLILDFVGFGFGLFL